MTSTSQADKNLFRNTVENSQPIDKDAAQQTPVTRKRPLFTAYHCITDPQFSSGEVIEHSRSGVSAKLFKKMKQGRLDKLPELDLHGENTTKACRLMADFIYQYQHTQFIKIIHGKGYNSEQGLSVLKTQVVSFLRQHPEVLAFHSCPAKNGGTGAVFVLLKNHA